MLSYKVTVEYRVESLDEETALAELEAELRATADKPETCLADYIIRRVD